MIHFKKIRWKNLLSTGNEFTEIILDRAKTTLVVGENGVGKSTLLDALSFALYGRAFRNINKPQLVNTINGSQMMTEVEFTVGGSEYLVRRGVKPDIFEIHRNGALMDQESSARDYQSTLEAEILKMNYKAFKQVVVLGSSDYTPFMALKADHRRQVIEDIIDIQIFTVMASMLSRRTNLIRDNIRVVENNLENLKNTLTIHRSYQSTFDENHQQVIKEYENEREQKLELADKLKADIAVEQQQNETRYDEIADMSSTVGMLEKLEAIDTGMTARLNSLKKEVNFLKTNETCPTCTQEIVEDFRSETIKKRSTEILEIVEGSKKIDDRIVSLRTQVKALTDTSNMIRASRNKIEELEREIRFLHRQCDEIERKIAEQGEKSQSHSNQELIEDVSLAIRNEASVILQLYKMNEVHEYATILLKDTGIKARLLKKYIPVINQLINKYLSQMNFFIQFELDENFVETIKSPYKDTFSYQSFSEGEKLRINLAILFTWREIAKMRNSMATNILIMDEIFDSSLDDGGVEDFLKIIEELTDGTNIFVISHKSQMFDKFRGAIRFKRQGNFSKIASEGA